MFARLILRNALRHRLRTALTVLGIFVAILAFGLLATVVDAWYAGAEGASAARLVTRNAVSLVFPLPLTHREKLRQIEGVSRVSTANWFGGIYVSPRNFFPQFAVDAQTYFDLYPEYRVPEAEMREFLRDRKGAIVGRKLADTYGWKVGDLVPLKGTIYAGNWEFVVRGIYDGRDAGTDTAQFFLHWAYLNESVRRLLQEPWRQRPERPLVSPPVLRRLVWLRWQEPRHPGRRSVRPGLSRSKEPVVQAIFSLLCLPYSASGPVSPVRMRMTCSSSKTKILPSPIFPVLADFSIASTT